jgi:hypothetical protein
VSAVRRREKNSLFKILIDTCVWLDLAKDYQQQPILTALEELIRMGDIELILPRTVLEGIGLFSAARWMLAEEMTAA